MYVPADTILIQMTGKTVAVIDMHDKLMPDHLHRVAWRGREGDATVGNLRQIYLGDLPAPLILPVCVW